MPTVLPHHFIVLASLLCLVFLATGTGRFVLTRTGISFATSGELLIFSAAAGFGMLSISIFILGACQILYQTTIWGVLGLFMVLAFVGWISPRYRWRWAVPTISRFNALERAAGCLLGASIVAGCLLALTPPVGNDTLSYHLAVPKLYLQHHGFYFIPGNIFAHYPLGSEMLYIAGLVMEGDVTAKAIHFIFALLVLTGMWQWVANQLDAFVEAVPALLIFFTIPSVFVTAHMAYSDLIFTLYVFLSVYAFLNWHARNQTGWLAFCGMLSGMAMATKYAGLLLPLLGCLGILWSCRHREADSRKAVMLLCVFLTAATVVGGPHYLKNWIMTGNPLYPFFYKIFGGTGWDPVLARRFDLFHRMLGMGRHISDYLMLPWNVSFHAKMNSPRFDGIVGPIFILTLPFAFGMRQLPLAIKVALAYCGISFLFWAATVQQIRYLMPIFPFLAIWVAYMLNYYRQNRSILVVLMLCIAMGLGYNGYHIVKNFQKIGPIPVLIGTENKEAFYSRLVPAYTTFDYVNTHLPADSKTLLIYMKNLGYLCDRPFYSDSIFESYTMEKILSGSKEPREVYLALKKLGFTHILYDIRYVFGDRSLFSPQNKSLFIAFQKQYLEAVRTDNELFYLFHMI